MVTRQQSGCLVDAHALQAGRPRAAVQTFRPELLDHGFGAAAVHGQGAFYLAVIGERTTGSCQPPW